MKSSELIRHAIVNGLPGQKFGAGYTVECEYSEQDHYVLATTTFNGDQKHFKIFIKEVE